MKQQNLDAVNNNQERITYIRGFVKGKRTKNSCREDMIHSGMFCSGKHSGKKSKPN